MSVQALLKDPNTHAYRLLNVNVPFSPAAISEALDYNTEFLTMARNCENLSDATFEHRCREDGVYIGFTLVPKKP